MEGPQEVPRPKNMQKRCATNAVLAAMAEGADLTRSLQLLVDNLETNDRRTLARMLAAKHDPLAALPIELIATIMGHLDLFCVWKLQAVCKTWRDVLSSEIMLQAALARWDTHDIADVAAESVRSASIASKVRHLKSIKSCVPFSSTVFEQNESTDHDGTRRSLRLCGHRLVYMNAGGELYLRDLITGDLRQLQSKARESLRLFALSVDLVAYTTYDGKLTVDGPQGSKTIRLPSANVEAIDAHRLTVSIALRSFGGAVVIYDYSTGVSSSFEREKFTFSHREDGSQLFLIKPVLHLNSEKKVLDVFEAYTIKRALPKQDPVDFGVTHTRYDFRGNVLDNSSLRLDHAQWPISLVLWDVRAVRLISTGHRDLYRLDLGINNKNGTSTISELPVTFFNAETASFQHLESALDLSTPRSTHQIIWKGRLLDMGSYFNPHSLSQNVLTTTASEHRSLVCNDRSLSKRAKSTSVFAAVNESFAVAYGDVGPDESIPSGSGGRSREVVLCFDEELEWCGAKKAEISNGHRINTSQ